MDSTIAGYLKQWDRARYLCHLLMPDEVRAHVLALYAFNAEMIRIPLLVSEPQIGEIRYQWWFDTLAAFEQGEEPDHPIARALFATFQEQALPLAALQAMVEAHTRLLYADRPADIHELEVYFGLTQSRLVQLVAVLLDQTSAPLASEAAGYAGVASGIADIMSERQRFSNLLPRDMTWDQLQKHGQKRLEETRAANIPTSVFAAFLPTALASAKLMRPDVTVGALRSQFALWRAMRRGCF